MPRNITVILLTIILTLSGALMAEGAGNDKDKKFTVVIDAGHGGKDVGATENGVMEKNINLKVARQLESIIKKKMKDVKVVMTRDDDTYLTLQQRADKANKSQGDLFISIHTNSVDKKNRNRKNLEGSSVYTLGLHKDENNLQVAMRENSVIELESNYEQKYSGFDPQRDESYIIFEMAQKKNLSQSIKLAETIEKELEGAGRKNRGVHQAGFWVLWATSMPSVLVELDFICNPQSAKYLASDKGAKELAEAIFKGVEKFAKSGHGTMALEEEEISSDENIAVATSRKRKITEKPSYQSVQNFQASQFKRKRRSAAAQAKSIQVSYEHEGLNPIKAYIGSVMAANDSEVVMADAGIKESTTNIKETKGKKQKKEKQPKAKKNDKKEKNLSRNAKVNKLVTVYKIQILASADLLSQNSSRFCGLTPISTYKENNLYKYFYGESTDRKELETVLADVRKKIPDAFIVSSTKSVEVN